MKKSIQLFVAMAILVLTVGYYNQKPKSNIYPSISTIVSMTAYPTPPVASLTRKKKSTVSSKGGIYAFINAIGKYESHGNPQVVSSTGFLGKYQFSPRTLRLVAPEVNRDSFLVNEATQDSVMISYMKQNSNLLRDVIAHFRNKWVNGVFITESGVLAGAHLVGTGGVKSFFYPTKYSYPTQDANGASVAMYMVK